jgi:hypothetical protein
MPVSKEDTMGKVLKTFEGLGAFLQEPTLGQESQVQPKSAGIIADAIKRQSGESNVVPIKSGPPPTDPAMVGRGAHIAALNAAARRKNSDEHLRAVLDTHTGVGYDDFVEGCRTGTIAATPADLLRLEVLHEEQKAATRAQIALLVETKGFTAGRGVLQAQAAPNWHYQHHHELWLVRAQSLIPILQMRLEQALLRFGTTERNYLHGVQRIIQKWDAPSAALDQLKSWWERRFAEASQGDELDAELREVFRKKA